MRCHRIWKWVFSREPCGFCLTLHHWNFIECQCFRWACLYWLIEGQFDWTLFHQTESSNINKPTILFLFHTTASSLNGIRICIMISNPPMHNLESGWDKPLSKSFSAMIRNFCYIGTLCFRVKDNHFTWSFWHIDINSIYFFRVVSFDYWLLFTHFYLPNWFSNIKRIQILTTLSLIPLLPMWLYWPQIDQNKG